MPQNTQHSDPRCPIDRRSLLISLLTAGLAAWPGGLAAHFIDVRQSPKLIEDLFERYFFDPAWIKSQEAQALFMDLSALAEVTSDPEAFCYGFAQRFDTIGLSHVGLSVQNRRAAQLGRHFDTMEIGPSAVGLQWHGTVACLSIGTFMGIDTGPRITAAFEEVTSNGAAGLILDLRDNPGGSFAMRHMVGHCISDHIEAGVLLSRAWYAENAQMPERAHIEELMPWRGSTLVGLWRHLATHPVTRVQFPPMRPSYYGPIAILINNRTASAAEMVAEVLQHGPGVVLVGEPSAGDMLVQRPFDVGDLFTLSLPVADYVSHGLGRIEGLGLAPDFYARTEDALSVALTLLSRGTPIPEAELHTECNATLLGTCARPIP